MIVREIKADLERHLKCFDWFNDYQDTRLWASECYPEAVPLLDAGHAAWLKDHNDHILEKIPGGRRPQ